MKVDVERKTVPIGVFWESNEGRVSLEILPQKDILRINFDEITTRAEMMEKVDELLKDRSLKSDLD